MNISGNVIPAVEKSVAILTRLGNSPDGATQLELAAELELAVSTCYRILQTLLNAGWVAKGRGGRYRLGDAFCALARQVADPARRFENAQGILEHLASETGLCVKLSIRRGEEQQTILRAESPRPVSVTGKVGAVFPVIEGSVGAALLADASVEEIRALAQKCRDEVAERNHPELICDRVQAIMHDGYTLNSGANRWRIDAMSVPVRDSGGDVIAALTLLGYDEDFPPEELGRLFRLLRRSAAECAKI